MPADTPVQLGMIGLGRMGANLVRRLMRDGHRCVAYDRNPGVIKSLGAEEATAASLYELFEFRDAGVFTGKVLSVPRSEFGGHAEKKA
jgi:6-phosphogluconate dehydrogenase (decarboxylating)